MNAGRDVERLIAGWLVDEAAGRAPDRVLDAARRSIDRTPQRRFVAAWREPMYVTPLRLAGLAAVLAIALIGGGIIGRATGPADAGALPTPVPSTAPSGGAVTVDSYRIARNAVCSRHAAAAEPLKGQLDGIFDPETPAADRASKTQALLAIVSEIEAAIRGLQELEAPPALAAGHAAYITRYQDMALFIREVLSRINTGDLEGAASVDEAINTLNSPMLEFEENNQLVSCP